MTITPPKPGTTKVGDVVCTICDIGCQLKAESVDGVITKVRPHDHPILRKNVCYKGTASPMIHNHTDRLRVPLKRVGDRGDNRWEEISYEQAMDEIAERLGRVVEQHGPEAFAVSTSGWNTAVTHGSDRRFMNLLGSPNYISGVSLCAGNTAAVNKLTYGWFPFPDYQNTKCIVLFGHNPRKHSWTPIFNMINGARANGAKVIVIDPRVSDQAEVADLHLRITSGTDAALCLGWLNVIINERLYDEDFVAKWTVGFEELRERVNDYPLEWVEATTGIPRDLIVESARMYATANGAVIPWTPITDMQLNSTSAIRMHSILRAITGNLDVVGGDTLGGFNPDFIPESDLELHDVLSDGQKAKQLGADLHPAYTYRAQEMLSDATEKVWGHRHANIVMGCYMANPSAVFRAMESGDPYPVKAFFTLGNNTLLSYPNQHRIHRALMNQDLIVAHEIFMTPTAMLADYVLPGDVFTERNHVADTWNWTTRMSLSQKVAEPPAEASSTYMFWHDLAHRMGLGEHFPWHSLEEVLDHRLSPSGMTFDQFTEVAHFHMQLPRYRKYEKTGFATPSGKVELYSSVLDDLGFDPLPYFREGFAPTDEYPYRVFTGVREDSFFQTGQRQVAVLRKRTPVPRFFIHPTDAARDGFVDGDWAVLETATGKVTAMIDVQDSMKEGHLRVPHGWWYPEMRGGDDAALSGAFVSSDAVLCPDDPEDLDPEQGIPHFKGFPGRLVKAGGPPAGIDPEMLARA